MSLLPLRSGNGRRREDVINFGAGPANMPTEVLEEMQAEMLNWNGCGMSVMEISHRSKYFDEIHGGAKQLVRELLALPDDYDALFFQGGATGQFAGVPLNLLGGADAACQYLVSGGWSAKALEEAQRFTSGARAACNGKDARLGVYTGFPAPDTWALAPDARYTYFCDNETVFGVEAPAGFVPEALRARGAAAAPLIADMSSNFFSRRFDPRDFAVFYGGAQKNLGPAGVTLLCARRDLLAGGGGMRATPSVLSWSVASKNDSLYNTPPTYAIYAMGKCLRWLRDLGGIDRIEETNRRKADAVYAALDARPRYHTAVREQFRSRMNVPFRILAAAQPPPPEPPLFDDTLEARFLKEAEARGLLMLKGHRSAGGMRASLYNSISLKDAEMLIDFLEAFADQNF